MIHISKHNIGDTVAYRFGDDVHIGIISRIDHTAFKNDKISLIQHQVRYKVMPVDPHFSRGLFVNEEAIVAWNPASAKECLDG